MIPEARGGADRSGAAAGDTVQGRAGSLAAAGHQGGRTPVTSSPDRSSRELQSRTAPPTLLLPSSASRCAEGEAGLEKFYAAVAGAFVMLFLTAVIHPVSKRLEALSRRWYGVRAISVHVERDPSLVWAGFPNWIAASAWLPELPADAPQHPTDWSMWAKGIGGADAAMTCLKITVTCREMATVVVDPPKLRFEQLPLGEPPKGVVVTCRVGGAAVEPRRIQVDLGSGTTRWTGADGEHMPSLSLALDKGETEQFYLFSSAGAGRYKWHLELPILVDGRREVIRVDDDGAPFVTYGVDGFVEYLWVDDEWIRRDAS